tara:strand:+ start:300 stop:989 length:690 start_codon:yes stop_codon:yes gene_type:complete
MLQQKNNNRIYFYIFSFIFLTTIINLNFLNKIKQKFLIKNININTREIEIKNKIFNKTNYLIKENIFFLNSKKLKSNLNDLNFLEDVKIRKDYPSTITISAKQTELLAITFVNQKKFYLGQNGELIDFSQFKNIQKLPTIFGKFSVSDYLDLKKELNEQNIHSNIILKYYFHKNKRWDLYLKENIIIQLPNKNLKGAINIFKKFKKFNNIKPNTIIDLRIPNRLVLNNV